MKLARITLLRSTTDSFLMSRGLGTIQNEIMEYLEDSGATDTDWFIAEYDGDDTFFGFVCLNGWTDCAEWSYISFKELRELQVKQSIGIDGQKTLIPLEVDRELHWTSKKAPGVLWIVKCGGAFD